MTSQNEYITDLLFTPLCVSASGAGLAVASGLIGMNTKFLGLPAPISVGLAMGASSLIAGTVKDTAFNAVMPADSSDMAYNAAAPVISGASVVALVYFSTGRRMPAKAAMELFALGAGAEIVGAYVADNFLGPALSM